MIVIKLPIENAVVRHKDPTAAVNVSCMSM